MKNIDNKGILVQNNYFDDVSIHPSKYSYEEVFYTAINYDIYQNYLFDYLMVECCTDGMSRSFKENLSEYDLYDNYIEGILYGSNNILRAYVILFLEYEYFPSFYPNKDDILIDMFDNDCDIDYKVAMALQYSTHKLDKETIDKLKLKLKYSVLDDEEMKNFYTNDELFKLLDEYFTVIDKNQSQFKEIMTYRYKKGSKNV